MDILLYITTYIVRVVYSILLILGIAVCNKNYFREGFYFFLITLILFINTFIAPYYVENILTKDIALTPGTLIIIIATTQQAIQTIITAYLIWGLYKKFKKPLDV